MSSPSQVPAGAVEAARKACGTTTAWASLAVEAAYPAILTDLREKLSKAPRVQVTSGPGTSAVRIYETERGSLMRVEDLEAAFDSIPPEGERS